MKKQYPQRLFHKTPSWVEDGAVFHIRIRCAAGNPVVLTRPAAANALWHLRIFMSQKGAGLCICFC
jgi:hypothetical protein